MLGSTEAIEDLGINVQISMIESTAAFKQFANGQSWAQLDFQTQQQIRLFAILEQAATKFGTNVYNNTASGMMQFRALLADVQLSIGQAFLPLVNAAMPYLITFANGLKYVAAVFSQFMQALFGVKTKQVEVTQAINSGASAANNAAAAQNNLGGATKKAAKAAKGSLAAFDEINQLQEQMADSADGAAGGVGGGIGGIVSGGMTVPDSSGAGKSPIPGNLIPQSVLDGIEKFKQKLADLREWFQPVIDKFDLLKEAAGRFGRYIYNLVITNPYIQGWIERTKKQFANLAEGLRLVFGGSLEFLAGQLNEITGIMSGDFELWELGFEQTCSGLADIAIGILMPIFPNIAKALKEQKEKWELTWSEMKPIIKKYGDPTKLEASDFGYYIRDELSKKWSEIKTDTGLKWKLI